MSEASLLLQPESLLRLVGKNDLSVFTEILGYQNAAFHNEWYAFLQHKFSPLKGKPGAKKFLLLWPRGHAKTETTSMNYTSWMVGRHPNIHINLVTKTASLAEEILTALITRFESDENYRLVFGDVKPRRPRKWTSREIIIERSEISKNPTVKATGLMGPITGGRSDLIICDDILDEENVRTRLQIKKVSTWFHKVLLPTLYPWGGIIVIGTRWSYADLYSELLDRWPHDVKSAISQEGKALWPEYWSLTKLEERRKEIGTVFFNCQYQNDPSGMTGTLLKDEWLHTYERLPRPLTVYAGVDPALGEGDLQSIAILGYDHPHTQGYLIDVWTDAVPLPDFFRKLRELHEIHHFAKIWVESNAFQKVLINIPEFVRGMPIVASPTSRNKDQRFTAMSSHFESKRILISTFLKGHKSEFWNEWVQFPHGQYDDALDSVEIVTRNVVTTAPADGWILGP